MCKRSGSRGRPECLTVKILTKWGQELFDDRRYMVSLTTHDAIIAVVVAEARRACAGSPSWWERRRARRIDQMVDRCRRYPVLWNDLTERDRFIRSHLGHQVSAAASELQRTLYGLSRIGSTVTSESVLRCWAAISLAGEYARTAYTLPLWEEPALDEHGIRLDIDAHLAELTAQLVEASFLYRQLGATPAASKTSEDRHVATLHRESIHAVDSSVDLSISRLEALRTYVARLVEVDRLEGTTERANQIELLDGRISDLVRSSGADELGADAVTQASRRLDEMRVAREDTWASLRGDYLAIADRSHDD